MLYTLYFIVTHSAPQEDIYGGIAMVTKMKNTLTHKEREKTETNLKYKMPSNVLKGEDAKEVHFDFQFICARFQPLSEHYSVRKLRTI